MTRRGGFVIAILVMLIASSLNAAQQRSTAVKNAFKRINPCPATGKPRGPCPGYIIDHITPLCAGGADATVNLQWQMVVDAKAKDKHEIRLCHSLRQP